MKIKVNETGFAIVSAYSIEQMRRVIKHYPNALKKLDDKGNVLFFLGVAPDGGTSGINSKGITFAQNGLNGKAVLNMPMPTADTDTAALKKAIVNAVGTKIVRANEIEAQIAAAISQVNEDESAVEAMIDIPVEVTEDVEG